MSLGNLSPAPGDNATVTLPRWFVVLLFTVLAGIGGAWLRIDASLLRLESRLSRIEGRLGIAQTASPGDLRGYPVPDATAAPIPSRTP